MLRSVDEGCPWNEQTATNAALEGHIHVLSWALRNGAPSDAKAVRGAFADGAKALKGAFTVLDEKIQIDAENWRHFVAALERLGREVRNTASAA